MQLALLRNGPSVIVVEFSDETKHLFVAMFIHVKRSVPDMLVKPPTACLLVLLGINMHLAS